MNCVAAIASKSDYHPVMVAFNEIEKVARKIGEQAKAEAVVLFGSHARGQAGANSDVDLLNADNNLAARRVPFDTVCFHWMQSRFERLF